MNYVNNIVARAAQSCCLVSTTCVSGWVDLVRTASVSAWVILESPEDFLPVIELSTDLL